MATRCTVCGKSYTKGIFMHMKAHLRRGETIQTSVEQPIETHLDGLIKRCDNEILNLEKLLESHDALLTRLRQMKVLKEELYQIASKTLVETTTGEQS